MRTPEEVVAVDVEVVYPDDDPEEGCYEAETVAHLREVEERADVEWLTRHGQVYASADAA